MPPGLYPQQNGNTTAVSHLSRIVFEKELFRWIRIGRFLPHLRDLVTGHVRQLCSVLQRLPSYDEVLDDDAKSKHQLTRNKTQLKAGFGSTRKRL